MESVDKTLVGIAVFTITIVAIVMYLAYKDREGLMTDCMADGHKRYECVSILRTSSGATIPVLNPIIVPRIGR